MAARPDRTVHRPVLLRETLRELALEPGLVVVDATVGAGGHAAEILKHIGDDGVLIGLDRDPMMLDLARRKLDSPHVHLVHASHADLPDVLAELGHEHADRVLLDLGLSSDQLADRERGFSFESPGPLDLRFDPTTGVPTHELLAELGERELVDALREYGEERFAEAIARELLGGEPTPRTAADVVAAVERAIPAAVRRKSRKHPATRVFQTLRILSNDELGHLERTLGHSLPTVLPRGGRAVVVTFHSLEDRLVKNAFRDANQWIDLTTSPISASPTERRLNPRSRSAKLRAAERR